MPNKKIISVNIIVFCLLMVFALPQLLAGEFTVFNKTYLRAKGSPNTAIDTFSVNNPNTTWMLQVVNGSLLDNKAKRVSSAVITLNGNKVLGQNSFNKNVNLIEIPVTVDAANTLEVTLNGKPGGQLDIEIIGIDNNPPEISGLTPVNGGLLNNAKPLISAQYSDDISGIDVDTVKVILDNNDITALVNISATSFTFTLTSPLIDGNHTLTVSVSDIAGNQALSTAAFTTDTTAPAISNITPADGSILSLAQPAISAAFSDEVSGIDINSVIITLDNTDITALSTITETGFNEAPAEPLNDGAHTLTVTVSDNAGNEASLSVSFTTDITAPTIANINPVDGEILSIFRPNISASYSDQISGIDISSVVITLDGDDVTAQSTLSETSVNFTSTIDLADGSHIVLFTVKDIAGNIAQAQTSFTILPPIPVAPEVALSETCTSAPEITASGIVNSVTTKVRIEGGANTVEVNVVDNGFTAVIPLKLNRINHLFFTAIAAAGSTSAPVGAAVTQDGQAPTIFIDFPEDGSEVTNDSVVIAGRVSDLLSGFMGLDVTVNGEPADVIVGIGTNGTFERQNVPLVLGPNTITAIATDKKGNTVSKQITINRIEIPVDAPTIMVISGNSQRARVNSLLPNPIVVKINHGDGSPFVNKLVNFKVIRSNGRLTADGIGAGDLELQARTDIDGLAQVYWTLGSDAGCGNNRIEVLSEDIIGTTFFCASADPNLPKQLNIGSGNNQRAEAGGPAPEPLKVWANDSCNGVEGVPITFTVTSGDGTVNGTSTITVNTSVTGHAEVNFVLGRAGGNNIIEANFPGNPGNPAVFNLFGVVRDESQPTTFTGLALNNSNLPIGDAQCSLIVGANAPIMTVTDVEGQFTFNNVIGEGPSKLIVDGLVATTLNGQSIAVGGFPALAFEPIIVPNAANSLATPVLLPALDPVNARTYDGTQDVVLTIDGIEGLEMVVKAGSMTRADGTVPSAADPAIIALNKVHFDKVPMPMPDGAAPPFAWTLQPAGAIFDPPVQITYPNMSGLPAGAIAYFLSFDHDTNRFEIVATGHVTDDGANIISDPGAGIVKAGWGCNCPPYAIVADCEGCAFKCINPGSLQGGSVVVNGTADVNDDIVCEGKTITFTASGVTHVDGELQVNCPDVGIIIDPIIGDPTYEWIITSPALSAPLTGIGATATVGTATAGVYTCVFTAKVEDPPGATVSCAPIDLPLPAITATAVRVEISDIVRGTGLPNSLSPNNTFTVNTTISPSLPVGVFVEFEIDNGNDIDAGSATIISPSNMRLTSSGSLTIKGDAQTTPGHSGILKIKSKINGVDICGESKGFSVCAHPNAVENGPGHSPIDTIDEIGMEIDIKIKSDSGTDSDLDQVMDSEKINFLVRATGSFEGKTAMSIFSGFQTATIVPPDEHFIGTKADLINIFDNNGAGAFENDQLDVFFDKRCGMVEEDAVVIPNSGYVFKFELFSPGGSEIVVKTSKSASTTTVDDKFTSGPGPSSAQSVSVTIRN